MATYVDGWPSKWIYGGIDQSKYVAVASGKDIPDWQEVMANAYLIATAPEMLSELENCCVIAKPGNPPCCCPNYGKSSEGHCVEEKHCSVWRVINKAKGLQ